MRGRMSRAFHLVTVALDGGRRVSGRRDRRGRRARSLVHAGRRRSPTVRHARHALGTPRPAPLVNFADVVERINPAVVNIDATTQRARRRGQRGRRRRRRQPGSVRRTVRLRRSRSATATRRAAARAAASSSTPTAASSRTITSSIAPSASRSSCPTAAASRARVVGTDPDTDIALIKIDGQTGLPVAPLGDSSTLRMGEWVVRDRQPARLRAHGHGRRRQLSRPEAVRREPRQLHPDRRRDQLRQQRRTADQQRAARSSASTRRSARARAASASPCRSTARRRFCRSCAPAAA